MLDRCNRTVSSLLLRCLACLVVTSVVTADGRVFVLDLRNSSGSLGFRDAERACASQQARLASAEELRHAVEECFFSPCTRGWLHGGTVGTTVCNIVGSALKAVDVRTENVTADTAHLDAFCVKDKGVPCGDPPSFPNTRLQGHSGFEMGDELLYTCVPGYVMPSGHSAFSLLCDSCGEWYGLVQICVKDETETHIDYEDKYTDSYEEEEEEEGEEEEQQHHTERPEEAHGEVYEEVHGAAYSDGKISQEQQETSYGLVEYQDRHGEHVVEEKKDRAVEDFVGHPTWEQERRQVVRIEGATATEAPVSLLSQKHMFWFPSEAFQEEGQSVSTNPGTQSVESKEQESQERHQHHDDADDHDHETESYGDREPDDRDDHDDSRHYDQDDHDSHHEEDDQDDVVQQHVPAQRDDLDRWDHHDDDNDDHSDHYDMGEHEDGRVPYGSREYHERDDTYDDHESYENHEDETDDHDADAREPPEVSREHPDHDDDDGEKQYDLEDNAEHDDHVHDDHDSFEEHESHEDDGDEHPHVIFSVATDVPQNVTKKGAGDKTTTDETWLDGYPVIPVGAEKGESTTESVKPEHREKGTLDRTTDRPNDVEIRRPLPDTISPEEHESPTVESGKAGGMGVWPGFIHTPAPYPELLDPSDSTSYSDTLDYDTQQPAPTDSWHGDLTEHPFLKQGPAPPVHDNDVLSGVMEEHNLPGETGERGEMEGEIGETICIGDNCPPLPPSSSLHGPTVIAIIVAVCAVAAAVIVGVWCYRRQQQKSSMYEMNGKGQSHTRHGQQIEMQQKV
ncbi:sushi domain-containing protein 5 [Solea senegalensis]|uniref:Sushi domain-containing protein 5 n=1 Tax=Solea senegalensis TaxID=28829 RepID=A0AAV6R7N8_SOLSE|nr:sushi domain-containing protein 5 [Solea senegalensis]KAG7501411.1 sushi domain-containing protein 5 [Solea senegalensis]